MEAEMRVTVEKRNMQVMEDGTKVFVATMAFVDTENIFGAMLSFRHGTFELTNAELIDIKEAISGALPKG